MRIPEEVLSMSETITESDVKGAVRDTYGTIARRVNEGAGRLSCCDPAPAASCCGPSVSATASSGAAARFYSPDEIGGLPDSVTGAALGCGNPIAISELQPGEVVLDLGSGGGIDCFLAAQQVGPEGRVIGLDMTPDMIMLARRNAKEVGVDNVDFRFGEMEDIPLPDESVDAVNSNCVINLSPDKDAVFGDVYRVLRPGGRMNVSDIVLQGQLPEAVRGRLDAWASCVAGALQETEYLGKIRAAGFESVEVLSRDVAVAEYLADSDEAELLVGGRGCGCEGDEAKEMLGASGMSPTDIAGAVVSIRVRARKPA
jgi:SAM-dependent methyltransferase